MLTATPYHKPNQTETIKSFPIKEDKKLQYQYNMDWF